MRMSFPLLIAAAAALSSCANGQYDEKVRAEGQKDLAQALDGYAATGKSSDCVNPRTVSGPQIIGNTTLLYRETGGRIWRNDVIGNCPSLREGQTLITEIKSGQLCRNDMFRTIEPGTSIPSAFCRLNSFTEYKRVRN
ncbi:hypothetical protein ACFO8O_00865 [Hephaestia sp. GCM10023244]|uniref:hypothetical protein n=1 Tax=unclassified Hephaestia TaxID=2631281 RepID=UPI0020771FAB|nr:hypothetical protein [Hephaestia sp. MAHUQ-44]MCM8729519.1 hypothetical protein [Hephaestia sp. MAHUQ-44]